VMFAAAVNMHVSSVKLKDVTKAKLRACAIP